MLVAGCSDDTSNQLPVAHIKAENIKDIEANETVYLSAEATDIDGDIVSYEWREGDTTLSDSLELVYTPTEAGEHNLTITVVDDKGAISSDTITINVVLPTVDTDDDTNETTSETNTTIEDTTDDSNNTTDENTAIDDINTTSEDIEDNSSSSNDTTVREIIPNKAPQVDAGKNQDIIVGVLHTFVGDAMDTDGRIIAYEWCEDNKIISTSYVLNYIPKTKGEHTLVFSAIDNDGAKSSDSIIINVIDSVKPKPRPQVSKYHPETVPENWYIRLVAYDKSRNMKTTSTILGGLSDSDAVQKHTLKALSPFGGSYLDVVFHNPEDVKEDDYKVNFHSYDINDSESWEFTVRTDDTDADIELSWIGLYVLNPYTDKYGRTRYHEYRSLSNPLISQMRLVDISSKEELPAMIDSQILKYHFNMDGKKEKSFRWVVDSSDLSVKKSIKIYKSQKLYKSTQDNVAQDTKPAKPIEFDLEQPPMFK